LTEKIKLTSDELRLMSLFQNITGAVARDCVVDEKMDRVIFVTKKVELVEYSEDPSAFLGNVLNSDMINEIKINNRFDGSRQAVVVVDSKKKGIVVGKEGRNAEKARILAKRYFQISNVMIVSEDHAQNN
jgi:transcription termination/antitermination protein NusA